MFLKILVILILIVDSYVVKAQKENLDLYLPTVDTANFKITKNDYKEYQLSVNIPNSQRLETINFEPSDNQLVVKGTLNNFYTDTMNYLMVNYIADKNGYRATFKIGKSLPATSVSIQARLSPEDLKSLAG